MAYVYVEKITLQRPKENVSVRYDEHDKPSKKLKPAVHLEKNIDHYFTWRPSLKEQIDCDALVLFRNDVT